MFLVGVRIEGMGTSALRAADLQAVSVLAAPPAGARIADAISLVEGALDAASAERVCEALGLAGPDLTVGEDGPLTDHLEGLDPVGVAQLLGPEARHVHVRIEAQLDPELFGHLRAEAPREPKLAGALGAGGLELKVGWLFNASRTHASIGVLGFSLGGVSFPTQGPDRPGWLPGFLLAVGGRLHRLTWQTTTDQLAARLHQASRSADPARRAGWRAARAALAEPPFSFGELELVDRGGQAVATFGEQLTAARLLGPSVTTAMQLCWAAHLHRPDVLVVELAAPLDDALRAWLAARIEGPDATLEQVLVVEPQ